MGGTSNIWRGNVLFGKRFDNIGWWVVFFLTWDRDSGDVMQSEYKSVKRVDFDWLVCSTSNVNERVKFEKSFFSKFWEWGWNSKKVFFLNSQLRQQLGPYLEKVPLKTINVILSVSPSVCQSVSPGYKWSKKCSDEKMNRSKVVP